MLGDFNIAPTDADVWDPAVFATSTHVTPPERQAVGDLLALGLTDVLPRALKYDTPFTYWDYRGGPSTRTSACGSTWCWPRRRSPAG